MGTEDKIGILLENGIPKEGINEIFKGALFFEKAGGLPLSGYWNSQELSNRDEFYVILSAYFGLIGASNQNAHHNDWRLKFDVGFLFQMKSNAQSAKSIELLTTNKCYADALVICRTLISRLNLLILFALNPDLFDFWAKDPKDKIFLDGQIRQELMNNNISLPSHLYELYSEIVHGQLEVLGEIGYFENGLFANVAPAENQIWITSKFAIATIYFTALCMFVQDCDGRAIPERFKNHQILFEWLQDNFLVHNRIDQIWTFLLKDRHIEKVGKDKYIVGRNYDFNGIKEQIEKFHRRKQKKKLSKKYDLKSDKK